MGNLDLSSKQAIPLPSVSYQGHHGLSTPPYVIFNKVLDMYVKRAYTDKYHQSIVKNIQQLMKQRTVGLSGLVGEIPSRPNTKSSLLPSQSVKPIP